MIYIGIDPGKHGAIVTIRNSKIFIHDMPLKENGDIDSNRILKIINEDTAYQSKNVFCVLEKAQAMRKRGAIQGTVSSFTYGIGYGKILAILDFLKMEYEEVRPMSWKKEFLLTSKKKEKLTGKERKELSEKKASGLFPNEKKYFYTQRGKLLDGRVEALLIAKYAEIKYTNKTRAIRGNK